MSRFNRALGLCRSVAIYHGIPLRQRRMRRLYASFVRAGDLVFDIGAHAGNRSRAFASMGCRVVALEPQPDFVRLLRLLFARSTRIEVVAAAAGEVAGRASLAVSERTPTVSTLSAAWQDRRSHESDFEGVRWNRQIDVDTTTLDQLIARFGVPAFIKIDVEGAEPSVLAGLSRPVPALSFEYLSQALDEVQACATRLNRIGSYRFNWSQGESFRLAQSSWLSADELMDRLRAAGRHARSGDVYARLADSRADAV